MLRRNSKGQSLLEYVILIVIVIGVFIAMQQYVKRGIQGRWKAAVDDLGEQYDPRKANSSVVHAVETDSKTTITTRNGTVDGFSGLWTDRTDLTNTTIYKTGTADVGKY
jgi:Flp pilus assembly pilin Flp